MIAGCDHSAAHECTPSTILACNKHDVIHDGAKANMLMTTLDYIICNLCSIKNTIDDDGTTGGGRSSRQLQLDINYITRVTNIMFGTNGTSHWHDILDGLGYVRLDSVYNYDGNTTTNVGNIYFDI